MSRSQRPKRPKRAMRNTTSVSLTRSDSDVYVPCADKTSLAKSKHSKSVAIVLGRVTHDHKHRLHTCNSQKICVSYRRKRKISSFQREFSKTCFVTVASGGQLCFLLLSHVAKSGARTMSHFIAIKMSRRALLNTVKDHEDYLDNDDEVP